MKAGHGSRAVRAAMFAAVCVLLAATGHVLMSGAPVSGSALALALVVTTAVAWAFAGHERGLLAVTSAAVAAQTALHTGFTLTQSLAESRPDASASYAREWAERLLCGDGATTLSDGDAKRIVTDAGLGGLMSQPPPGTVPAGAGGAGHHAMHGMTVDASTTVASAVHGGHEMTAMSPTGMLAAHLLAAVLCGLWLAYGERAVFRVLRAFAGRLWTPFRLLLRLSSPPRRPRPRVRRTRTVRALRQLLIVHSITSRGPPRGTAVA
ncbi:hypothetical protein ACFYQ5_25235 [Streptomyces sp. NPDC005794]|uniref:hypothetical protein n=1 Tax=Streptomyces sp. NPDC005794 TaxID=3364733 RepID=UPI0036A1A32C